MRTQTISRQQVSTYTPTSESIVYRVKAWMNKMDYYRIPILSFMIISQGCVFAPAALWSMDAAVGYSEVQAMVVIVGLFSVLVTNLAVQPMRVTIPTFVVSAVAQLSVLVINLVSLIG